MAHIGFSLYLHVEIRNRRIIVPYASFDASRNDVFQKWRYGFVALVFLSRRRHCDD
jgi:hypothetical protein